MLRPTDAFVKGFERPAFGIGAASVERGNARAALLASITTRLITAAMGHQRSDPTRDVAEHLDTLLDTVTITAHGIENGQPVRGIEGPIALAGAQLHALARRRKAHFPAHTMQAHLAHYLDKLTAVAIDAADAADLHAATIADGIH